MSKWFTNILLDLSFDEARWDPDQKGPVFDWIDLFEDEKLQKRLKQTAPCDSWEEDALKNILDIFEWFRTGATAFMQQVGNDARFTASPDY